jgi:hypothetical protein
MPLRRLLRRFSRRPAAAPDFGPLPPCEYDDGRELVITRSDGTRLHLPSRATRDLSEPPPQPPPRALRPSEVLRQAVTRRQHDGAWGQ